jgi:hypothetical protein
VFLYIPAQQPAEKPTMSYIDGDLEDYNCRPTAVGIQESVFGRKKIILRDAIRDSKDIEKLDAKVRAKFKDILVQEAIKWCLIVESSSSWQPELVQCMLAGSLVITGTWFNLSFWHETTLSNESRPILPIGKPGSLIRSCRDDFWRLYLRNHNGTDHSFQRNRCRPC